MNDPRLVENATNRSDTDGENTSTFSGTFEGESETQSQRLKPRTGRAPRWAFVPLAPLVVLFVGLAVALSIGFVGLNYLARAGDDHASARAGLLSATLAARVAELPNNRRLEALQLSARRTAAEIMLVTPDGRVVHDVTLGAPDRGVLMEILAARSGVAKMRLGRARFVVADVPVAPPDALRLVAMVYEPPSSKGASALVSGLIALVTLLLGTAVIVAYAVSRDVTRDVDFLTRRVHAMSRVFSEPAGELVPARTMDEVGVLTVTFNALVGRFESAERAYRQNLTRAEIADRERAAFLAAVSHELRSPLNAILGFADVLMSEVDGPLSPSAREEVDQIRDSGAHLLGLINDILEFSALESGQLRLTRAKVDLTALATDVVREARGLVGDKPIQVRVQFDEPVMARADARRMRQIIGNLVNNAVKFTQRGEVVVSVGRKRNLAFVRVSDTGPGISPEERQVIFREYKQAPSEHARRRGTGLGLAISKRLMSLHRGSIRVESELGRGSTFEVVFPIGNLDAAPSTRTPVFGKRERRSSRRTS